MFFKQDNFTEIFEQLVHLISMAERAISNANENPRALVQINKGLAAAPNLLGMLYKNINYSKNTDCTEDVILKKRHDYEDVLTRYKFLQQEIQDIKIQKNLGHNPSRLTQRFQYLERYPVVKQHAVNISL